MPADVTGQVMTRPSAGQHGQDVPGGVGEPGHRELAVVRDAALVLRHVRAVVALHVDALAGELVDRLGDIGHLEVQDGVRRGLEVGLRVDHDGRPIGEMELERAHLVVLDLEAQRRAVERARRVEIVDREAREGLRVVQHADIPPRHTVPRRCLRTGRVRQRGGVAASSRLVGVRRATHRTSAGRHRARDV